MARIRVQATENPGQLPFLDVLLESGKIQVGQVFELSEVSESRKRSGYLLKSDDFMIFIWKSSEILQPLLAELERFALAAHAPSLWAEISEESVEGFALYFDDAELRQWVKNRKKLVLDRFQSHPVPGTTRRKQS
jgi:hypothetical protein